MVSCGCRGGLHPVRHWAQASQPTAAQELVIELRRGALTVKVSWPVTAASECAAWMRELLR